ncbi:hypothetical protein [Deinococcus sp. NW-56]|uniref:hypothetical protein n=1 Tax=Deinococcus sp. NW-56 TaxID=2080419 RepID=UPI000CF57FAE|nr:hypothetical protein [Deinococcus sp. NW-56]
MRGCAELLSGWGRASTWELSAALTPGGGRAAQVSTRRALRVLEARGVVTCLGFDLHGHRVYCLSGDRAGMLAPWLPGSEHAALTGGGLLPGYMRPALVRLWNTSRLPLTREQREARRAG